MTYPNAADSMLAPHAPYILTDTGTTEDSNAVVLPGGKYASLKVGAVAVCVRFAGEVGLSAAVDATTALILNSWETFHWVVEPNRTDVVYAEAADGVSVYKVWVWPSSVLV